MSILNELKFTLRGFSPRRVAYVLSVGGFGLAPLHTHVSCEMSGALCGMSMCVVAFATLLCFIAPRATANRFAPVAIALLAFFANTLFSH